MIVQHWVKLLIGRNKAGQVTINVTCQFDDSLVSILCCDNDVLCAQGKFQYKNHLVRVVLVGTNTAVVNVRICSGITLTNA